MPGSVNPEGAAGADESGANAGGVEITGGRRVKGSATFAKEIDNERDK
jgi:hypothetical protein